MIREPAQWVELIPGVRLLLRRPDGFDDATADAKVSAVLQRVIAGAGDLSDYGFEAAEMGVLAEPEVMLGLSTFVSACAYAGRLIEAWGIGGADGEQPEITPQAVAELMRYGAPAAGSPPLLRIFNNWLRQAQAGRAAEGKDSPPSRPGIGAGAAPIATDAARKTRPAPKASPSKARTASATAARTTKTRRRRTPGS